MKTRTKLIWFLGGVSASGLAIALLIFLIQAGKPERGSGRIKAEQVAKQVGVQIFAEGQGEQAPEKEPERSGSGRRDSQN